MRVKKNSRSRKENHDKANNSSAQLSQLLIMEKHNRITSGELLSNDRLALSVASYDLVRLALAELKEHELPVYPPF